MLLKAVAIAVLMTGCAPADEKVICQPYFAWNQTTGEKYDAYWDLNHKRETSENNCDEVWFDGKRLR